MNKPAFQIIDNFAELENGMFDTHENIMREFAKLGLVLRGETANENGIRRRLEKKSGKSISKFVFWTVEPRLRNKPELCISSIEEARERFEKKYKETSINRNRKRVVKPRDYVVLPVDKFVRVMILRGDLEGRRGVVAAVGRRGYRVAVEPDEAWKKSYRRWMQAEDIQPIGKVKLPTYTERKPKNE